MRAVQERTLPRVWLFGSGVLLLAWLAALVLEVRVASAHWGLWALGVAVVVAGFSYVRRSTRAVAKLTKNVADYFAFVDQAADGIFIADLQTGQCLLANKALAKMLRRPVEVVQRLTLIELLSPRQHAKTDSTTVFVLPRGAQRDARVLYREDGTQLPVEVGVTTITLADRQVQLAVIRDVSEQQRLQQQLLQMQKLDAIGRLAGGVAHDLNNILTAILGHSDRLARQGAGGPTGQQSAAQISESAQRAAALTRQLLAFSRKQALAPRVFNLNPVLAQLEPMLRQLLGEDVTLQTDLAADLANVKADAGQLESVIVNLVVNARDAMPTGGQLLLRTVNFHPTTGAEVPPGRYVLLAVRDTGTGMSEEVQAHLFEPFFTTKAQGEGTGLGLATAAGVIRQSGGYLLADSAPGKGSEFRIYLPATTESAAPAPAATPAPAPAPAKRTVLLVDDEAAIREFAGFVLRDLGYTVHEAGNGVEALALAKQQPPGSLDLLLTDVVMPQMGGKQLADQFALVHPRAKVMFISGFSADALSKQQLADATHLLPKPFTGDQLVRKVEEVLAR